MTNIPRVGVTPVPSDTDVQQFLNELCEENYEDLCVILVDMKNTIEQTRKDGQPEIYAYGKLLNYLASNEVGQPKLVRLLAAAIWEYI